MAKRGRAVSLDRLISKLSKLDRERKALLAGIKAAFNAAVSDRDAQFPVQGQTSDSGEERKYGRTPRKLSAAGRAAIAAAQRKRWAKIRKQT